MAGPQSDWLRSTLSAVRELMLQRLEKRPLDAETERDLQMALEELEVMWEELQGQAELLQKESERYQEFFDYAPDAYVVTDAGCSVREANRAALELLGTDRTGLVGRPLGEFVAEADRPAFVSKFVGLSLEPADRAIAWRCRLRRPDGSAAGVTITVRAIPLRRSGIAGLCWLMRPD